MRIVVDGSGRSGGTDGLRGSIPDMSTQETHSSRTRNRLHDVLDKTTLDMVVYHEKRLVSNPAVVCGVTDVSPMLCFRYGTVPVIR